MSVAEKLKRMIAEEVAKELIDQQGRSVRDINVALAVADAFSELEEISAEPIIDLAISYIEIMDVGIYLPAYKLNEDGTVKTAEEIEKIEGDF